MKRTSITLEDSVYDAGQEIAAQRGFRQSFSAYIAWLIQRDANGAVSREELPSQIKKQKASADPASGKGKGKHKK